MEGKGKRRSSSSSTVGNYTEANEMKKNGGKVAIGKMILDGKAALPPPAVTTAAISDTSQF